MVEHIQADEVVQLARRPLGLPENIGMRDEAFLSALVRRAAAYRCPCSPQVLARAVMDGLQGLASDPDELAERIDTAVEKAMIAGDLLELSQVTIENPLVKSTWVFGAPPAFIARPSGKVLLMGITLDEPCLPALAPRIVYDAHYRWLSPEGGEDLPHILRELGLLELTDQNWLRPPKAGDVSPFVDRFERELANLGPAGDVSGLTILDTTMKSTYYRGRWTDPKKQSGRFVARRPQAYGADIWGFAMLQDGALVKFLDFPRKSDHWRGCDIAWHLQMGIDSKSGSPQRYRIRRVDGAPIIDFFSPLPSWAERRLAVIGRPAPKNRCLFSYRFSEEELATEVAFLEKSLWLAPLETQEGE